MTDYLEGNHIAWGMDSSMRTTFQSLPRTYDVGSMIESQFQPDSDIRNKTMMPLPGQVVGIIVHVTTNSSPIGSGFDTFFEFQKTEDNGTTVVNTGVKVTVPAGETGFFYSNTDISEFTRSWEKFEFVSIRRTIAPKPSLFGIGPPTVMLLLDLDN